ncbi:hypothetical protein [Actinophytocola sp.]|uniref:hypothetical protein n=1 Tax=Actinophytocola sp. TaxID=1872138 RepID=UPI002ED1825B
MGVVVGESPAPAGRHSEISTTLRTSTGRVFVKGITTGHSGVRAHRHEAAVNVRLPDLAPRLLWTVEVDGWLLLGFEHVAGRHADLSPGSPDLPLLTDALGDLACRPAGEAPDLATQWVRLAAWRRLRHKPPVDLHPWSRANLDRFVDWERHAVDVVAGDHLAHTDLHSLNVLVGQRLRVVDWAWSRAAVPWLDAGFVLLRLIDAGHSPTDAEQWMARVDAWAATSDEDQTAFAVAVLGIWEFLQRDQPLPHRARLTDAARRWVRHRLGQ